MTRLHLVNGFLGSGKTTAIVQAAREHMARGERVGVVTNDQGRFLVDSAFVRAQQIPVVQVTGGCFCCSFDQLLDVLTDLNDDARPDVIYAESVGSCADLVATVVLPLRAKPELSVTCESLSVFADSRLLLRLFRGEPLPFSDSVLYIMESQLEEAGTLVLNKIDLLDDAAVKELLAFSEERLPGRPVLAQNSLDQRHVLRWIEMIDSGGAQAPRFPARVDYDRYGEGETQLAWVDRALSAEDLGIGGRMQVIAMVREIAQALAEHRVPVAHVKFHVSCPGASAKISLTTLSQTGWESEIPDVAGAVELLVNARVQAESERAGDWIDAALERACVKSGGGWRVVTADTLTPQAPRRPY